MLLSVSMVGFTGSKWEVHHIHQDRMKTGLVQGTPHRTPAPVVEISAVVSSSRQYVAVQWPGLPVLDTVQLGEAEGAEGHWPKTREKIP